MDLVRGVIEAGNRVVGFDLAPVEVIVRGDLALLRYNAEKTLEGTDGQTRVIRYSSADLYMLEDGVWRVLAANITYLSGAEG